MSAHFAGGRSQHFEIVIDQVAAEQIFRFHENSLERLLEMRGVIGKADDTDLRSLPGTIGYASNTRAPRSYAYSDAASSNRAIMPWRRKRFSMTKQTIDQTG